VSRCLLRASVLLVAARCVAPAEARAGVAADPAAATAFIRVIGTVRAEYQGLFKEKKEKGEVELATGTGFVVSPQGYLLTCRHVVAGDVFNVRVRDVDVKATLEAQRIEVYLPGAEDGSHARFEASVVAEDATLDLALLSISASDLSYLPLGDSDAMEVGAPVRALGFPFGRQVDVGRSAPTDAVPAVTVSAGHVSAFREGDDGRVRLLQTDATLNPGQSGGPVVDAQGYAVGVIEMKLREAEGIGFATAINAVKGWLVSRSADQFLPTRGMRLGPPESFPGKGIRLRVMEGFADRSPSRLRLEGPVFPPEVLLIVDRVASPSSLDAAESLLRSGRGLPGIVGSALGASRPLTLGGRPAVRGALEGQAASTGRAWRTEFVIADLGKEKVVARYAGPPEAIAFNLSLVRASLASLEAEPLLRSEVRAPLVARLEAVPPAPPSVPVLRVPAGWVTEAVAPAACRGLPRADWALTASPEGDFTVSLRAAWWSRAPAPPEPAAAACRAPGGAPSATYAVQRPRFDVAFVANGTFVAVGPALLRLELEAPAEKQAFVKELLRAWLEQAPGAAP
jgi:S1-C subfamily serine protease